MQKFVVSKDPTIYEAWPDVCLMSDGRLICVFSECSHHLNRDLARVTYVTSDDRGRTWTEKKYLTDQGVPSAYFNCARVSVLSDGTVAVICDLICSGNGKGKKIQNFIWFSKDNGHTWSEPMPTPADGIVPEKLTELPGGRWLVAAHKKNRETGKSCQYCWYSDDKGQTWSDKITIANDPRYKLCEAGLLVVDENTVVCFMRENSEEGLDCFKSISRDRGETWDGVYHVPIPGCHRPTVGWLSNGQFMVTYRFMQGGSSLFETHQNVFGALLPAESVLAETRKGHSVRIFPIFYDRNRNPDCGYTGWVQFEDGEILVVTYIKDDAHKAWIQAASFTLDELIIDPLE